MILNYALSSVISCGVNIPKFTFPLYIVIEFNKSHGVTPDSLILSTTMPSVGNDLFAVLLH